MIKRVPIDDVEVGMFITDFHAPWVNHPFLSSRRAVRTASDIESLRKHGIQEVSIDTARGKDSRKAVPVDEADAALRSQLQEDLAASGQEEETPSETTTAFEEELRKAKEIYEEAKEVLSCVFETVRLGKAIDGERTRETVTMMIDSILRNRDALLSLARLTSYDEYTLCHCLKVAVLALHLGASLGILQDELLRLGIGSVLHDLGKARLPPELLKKGERLTPREFEVVKSHPAHGASLILQCASLPDDAALAALNHHERYDGSGYPRGLSGLSVGKFGLIVAIVDVYDAMTSERSYQKRLLPTQALKRIYEWAGSYLHPIYARKLIQCLGIYPIGSVVALDTGEMGVVVHQNRDQTLRPRVRVCRRADGRPLLDPVDVDLRESDPSGQKPHTRSVHQVLPPDGSGLDVAAILAQKPNPIPTSPLVVVLPRPRRPVSLA